MLKLVVLTEGMTGLTHELKVEKTTIGRVEDNTFPLGETSVSSHHCEVLLRGEGALVRDLNSTNGTFVNGEKVSEAPLKPGDILRLGRVELRLESDIPTPGAAVTRAPVEQTVVMQRGVSLSELESGAKGGFDLTSKGFTKKDDKASKLFWIGAIALGTILLLLLIYVFAISGK